MNIKLKAATLGITPERYAEWRSPRFGTSNPTRMDNLVWEWLIRTRITAYGANEEMNGPSPFDAGPGWCFNRFGQSSTVLPDGRKMLIGGEHEDYYDADFYIYNDVVVIHPDQRIEIYAYPREVFAPTDFHSATLVGDKIWIVGCIGYVPDRQFGETPVYTLDIHSFAIEKVVTTGDKPGWISEQVAQISASGQQLLIRQGQIDCGNNQGVVENIDRWSLDLNNLCWKRLSRRNWARWEIFCAGKARANNLWELRHTLWKQEHDWLKDYQQSLDKLTMALGKAPDFAVLQSLYQPPVEHQALPEQAHENGVFRIVVQGVTVRYVENHRSLLVTVEGDLPASIIETLKQDVLHKFELLENHAAELFDISAWLAQHDTTAISPSDNNVYQLIDLSSDYNGRVREANVKRLGKLGDIRALPALFIRANDWVPQVRQAAVNAILQLLTDHHAAAFVTHLADLYRLKQCSRAQHEPLIQQITSFLLQTQHRGLLVEALDSENRDLVRLVARLCITHELLAAEILWPWLMQQHDVALKILAVQHWSQLALPLQLQLINSALHSRFMPLRRMGYLLRLRHAPELTQPTLQAMLLDHAAIRSVAVAWIKTDKEPYITSLRQLLQQEQTRVSQQSRAILALAELGATVALDDIRARLQHEQVCIRKAVLLALALLKQDMEQLLITALADNSPAVVKLAGKLIEQCGIYLDATRLIELAQQKTAMFALYLQLSKRLNKWDRLNLLLHFVSQFERENPAFGVLMAHLENWEVEFNRYPQLPSATQLKQLESWLAQHASKLDEHYQALMRFNLACYGG